MGPMTRFSVVLIALSLLTSAFAAVWAYTSHKYDCFNIGPCVGDVDYWINLGDFAVIASLASWMALLVSTVVYSKMAKRPLTIACVWLVAILLPPAVLFSASWLFNLGIFVSTV